MLGTYLSLLDARLTRCVGLFDRARRVNTGRLACPKEALSPMHTAYCSYSSHVKMKMTKDTAEA